MDATTPPGATYRFDRFTLDLVRGALLSDGVELPLRPKSFALLRFLVENAGRLLDRDTIMTAVWPDVVVTDESITQCVRDIRKALGDKGRQLLRTVPRRGYRFAAAVVRAEPAVVAPERWPTGRTPAPGAERRQLTVLVCDLVDSTALCEQLDPEDFSSIIGVLLTTCAAVVTRCHGHVAGHMGDGLLAYFGYPHA
jgi:DNA-binding winged helix-turn-helix (wHTH) protein